LISRCPATALSRLRRHAESLNGARDGIVFRRSLKRDLSLTNFIASDFTMLNGRLAKHYGIPGVDGWEFRRVALPPAVIAAGAHDGERVEGDGQRHATSPVTRGAWVLDRILGTPPPKPPEAVAQLEPDIRGATTIASNWPSTARSRRARAAT